MDNLYTKLEAIHIRFEEVGKLLVDPDIIADMDRYIKLNKEYKELEEVNEYFTAYHNLLGNIKNARQIIAEESGVASVADPLGGSYLVEGLTTKIYNLAKEEIMKIDGFGGSLKAIEAGYQQREIHHAAFDFQKEVESGERKIIGVNYAINEEEETFSIQSIDSNIRDIQTQHLESIKSKRDEDLCEDLLNQIRSISSTEENIFPKVIEAVRARCTLGEIINSMKSEFGTYRPPSGF